MSFHPLIIEFFLIYLAMAQNRGRIHTKDFVEVSKGGGWLGNCSPWEGANDLPWKEEIVWETERVQGNYTD